MHSCSGKNESGERVAGTRIEVQRGRGRGVRFGVMRLRVKVDG